jgi:SAM-dependent methyltransferase
VAYAAAMEDQPPRLFDRARVRRNFARAHGAARQAMAEFFAREVEDRLLPITREFERVLLCGPHAAAVAPLLSRIRLPIVQGRDVAFDDDALPFVAESFDCIVSLGALQSVDDLPGALLQLRRALKPDGLLLAALFAGATLTELRRAWIAAEAERRDGASPRIAPMADLRDLAGLLQRAGFALPVADLDRTTLRYADPLALMRETKAAGYGNALVARARGMTSVPLLAAVDAHYPSDSDGRVSATVDIAWLTGWAPHASQPQPLRPGTATARLADALGAKETKLPRE